MAQSNPTEWGNQKILIGAGVLILVAAIGGYQLGSSNGEAGLTEAQSKVAELVASATEQASKIKQQTETLSTQRADIDAKAAEIQTKSAQIVSQAAALADKTAKAEKLTGQVASIGNELSDTNGKLAELTARLSDADRENQDYLETIMAGIGKQDFNLHVGGRHRSLIENRVDIGLSYVSRADMVARVTLSGQQMSLKLQNPERIRLKGLACELNLSNLVSDTEATFQLKCDR